MRWDLREQVSNFVLVIVVGVDTNITEQVISECVTQIFMINIEPEILDENSKEDLSVALPPHAMLLTTRPSLRGVETVRDLLIEMQHTIHCKIGLSKTFRTVAVVSRSAGLLLVVRDAHKPGALLVFP